METHVESANPDGIGAARAIRVRMFGPLDVSRDGVSLKLPQSRKVRGLLAYLILAPRAVGRSNLCELLWDVPNDPRGELRWCLSKVRSILDEPDWQRVTTSGDAIALELGDCFVDAIEIAAAAQAGVAKLEPARLKALSKLFVGDFLDGLEIDRNPQFNGWLVSQRRRFRACHAAILEHLVKSLPAESDELLEVLEDWLKLAPFDRPAHEIMLAALARRGRIREGEEHLAAAIKLFEDEGLDWKPLREAWQVARISQPATAKAGTLRDAAPPSSESVTAVPIMTRRASIAVMPFAGLAGGNAGGGGLADGLTHDVITRLAKLRSLFVIAQGSVFALGERSVGAEEAGRTLNVDYVASGTVHRRDKRLMIGVELVEARTARIVWADMLDRTLDDTFSVLDEIGNHIVASIAGEIEMVERNRAVLKPPDSLDAWEAYHRGLWHMYRFNGTDNDRAQHFFQMSVRLDPTFARAYSGLSFTHFQNAFLLRPGEREDEIRRALDTANQSLTVDDRDPASHCAMGRALWLSGRQDQSLSELATSVDLSPNFAIGHYTLAFVHAQSGDPGTAIGAADHSRHLSPFDPLLFAMLASRAIAHFRLGEFDEATEWALKGAARPNAHHHAFAVAAHSLAMTNRLDEARTFIGTIRKSMPNYRLDDFLASFHFSDDAKGRFRESANRLGLN